MYRPFLFVGLGGSGGKTLRYVKHGTMKWLASHGWDKTRPPEGWQFLHIDTPTIPDGKELNSFVPMLDPSEYLGLVGDGVDYTAVSNALDNLDGMANELVGWRIDPVSLAVPIGEGAGQFRAVGRTIAMLQGRAIRTRIKNSFHQMKTPAARASLGGLYSAIEGKAPGADYPAPIVIVVSSLAGGTGAGLLMNVCDIISELGESSESLALLYTPEVFETVPGASGAGVQANSLAAISEILNGNWLNGTADTGGSHVSVASRNGADLRFAGASQSLSTSGPAYPFLIGRKNASGASFGTDRALFSMVGSALVAWLTDTAVQDVLIAYAKTNWQSAQEGNNPSVDVLVNAGTNTEMGLPPFSALGVSSLSIGLDYLETYSAQRLVLEATTILAHSHTESDAAKSIRTHEGVSEPDELARRLALQQLSWFLHKTQLGEKGPDDNQVIDALSPDVTTLVSDARESILRLAEVGTGGTASGSAWAERINSAADQTLKAFDVAFSNALEARCIEWVATVPHAVVHETEEVIARHGVRTAAALIRAVANQILEDGGVAEELQSDALRYREFAARSRRATSVLQLLESLGGRVPNNHATLTDAVEAAIEAGRYAGEGRVQEVAADLLRSFAGSFLKPLAAELEEEAASVESAILGDVSSWPQWDDGAPPSHLEPPPSEQLLVEPSAFAAEFKALLSDTYPKLSPEEARREVTKEIVTGAFLRDSAQDAKAKAAVPAIRVTEKWSPEHGVLRTLDSSRASFSVQLNPDALLERARAWMHRPSTPFADFLSQTLRTYLDRSRVFGSVVPEARYAQRRQQFIPKLQAALATAAPLVNLDAALMSTLHPGMQAKPSTPILSQLPFKNHALEEDVRSVLIQIFEGQGDRVSDLLTTKNDISKVSIASTLRNPCSPLVMESLLRPIAEAWSAATQSDIKIKQFWQRRRARPLDEFIPAPQEHILAMCRGWFAGASLGIIDRKSSPIRIGRANDAPAMFPTKLLSRSADGRDQLALVLESLAVAYVGVMTESTLRPLDAYNRLRDIGRYNPDDDRLLEYPGLSPLVLDWVSTGISSSAIVDPLVSGSTPTERLEALRSSLSLSLSTYSKNYEDLLEVWRKQRSKLGEPPLWPGIRWHITTALSQLLEALNDAIANSTTSGPGDVL